MNGSSIDIKIHSDENLVYSEQNQKDDFDDEESCKPGLFVDLVEWFVVSLHDEIK